MLSVVALVFNMQCANCSVSSEMKASILKQKNVQSEAGSADFPTDFV
jgi:hypothetical protein